VGKRNSGKGGGDKGRRRQRSAAVIKTLMAVTIPVPKRRIILSLNMLDTTVPPTMIIESNPALCNGTFNDLYIEGHAEPSGESANLKPVK
jgi:hypothetical protein